MSSYFEFPEQVSARFYDAAVNISDAVIYGPAFWTLRAVISESRVVSPKTKQKKKTL